MDILQSILDFPVDKQLWFVALFIWTIVWKGMALWKAAKSDSKPWFIALLLVNTLGVLEILYVYVIAPRSEKRGQ